MERFIILILIFVVHGVVAQENVLTPADVARLEVITDAAISENGETIVFQKLVPADPTAENVPPKTHLYIYDKGGQTSTALVTEYSVSNLKFRPTNNSITFTAKQENDSVSVLYEIPVSGGEVKKLY